MATFGVTIFLAAAATVAVQAALPPSLRYPLPVAINKITDVIEVCDAKSLNVTVSLKYPFKGLLFAKDFSQECRVLGASSDSVSINLPTSGCGVRLSSKTDEDGKVRMYYGVTVVIQQDRHLKQISDQERHVECQVQGSAFTVSSETMADVVKNELMDIKAINHRTGRMKEEGWSKDVEEITTTVVPSVGSQLNEALSAARAWMEIVPEQENASRGTLQVGEPALLTVKCTLPAGIGWRVVDCMAHDGLGDSSQKLLDDEGCPIDDLILPTLRMGPARPISFMRHQEAVAKFAAFKFPDRDRLHLNCGLQLCRGQCEQIDCGAANGTFDNRLGRNLSKSKGKRGEVLDRIEVFNSVEVLAPGIELDDVTRDNKVLNSDLPKSPFGHLPGDRAFCVSPDKMAITFCVLGLIFLGAVLVAVCALMRARRSGISMPYYTRSIFSSSSGSGFGGSKLLLRESPCMSQSTSRGLPYGRIL